MAAPRVPWWRLLALASVAVTGIFLLTRQHGPDAAPVAGHNAPERARLAQIESELQALSQLAESDRDADRAQLEARMDALQADVQSIAKGRKQAPAATRADAGPTTGESPAQRATLLDERFTDEAADPGWSVAAAQEISLSLLSPGLESTQLGEVRCRATLCRIEATHGSLEAERKFIAHLGELEEFRDAEGFVERVPRSDGSIATTVFVSRSGHRLPSAADGVPLL